MELSSSTSLLAVTVSIFATAHAEAETQAYINVFTNAEAMIGLLDSLQIQRDRVFPPMGYLAALGVSEDLPPFWKLRRNILQAACEIATRDFLAAPEILRRAPAEWDAALLQQPLTIRDHDRPAVDLVGRIEDYFIVVERGMYSPAIRNSL
ncbi:hypothetical protein NCC49_004789 [Naganishia albida]|nr:hypothetical protein NCC49_004789 [Naganishia albida]